MRVVVLYRPNSEHAGQVEDYLRDFKARYGLELDTLDIDSAEGMSLAELYDITRHPAILTTADDGSLQQLWQGSGLPLLEEVYAYRQRV